MRVRIIPFLIAGAFAAVLAGCAHTGAKAHTLHVDSTAKVQGKVGEVMTFGLPGNAGTGYTWNQVAAAGRPPEDKWQPTWFGRQVFDARDEWFEALPVRFLPLDTPHRVLVRGLQRNELVGIAVDGRIPRR